MNVIETIEKIFNEKPESYSYIETGLTNDNYIVRLKDKTVVLRIPRSANEGLFDYHHEDLVLNLVKNLALEPKLLYYNKDSGIKCSEYIENAETYETQYILRAAKLIKQLHDANLSSGDSFEIKKEFKLFQSRLKNPLFDTSFAHHYIDDLEIKDLRLCHNDLVKGNLLFTHNKDYLIDYEYAKDNDPYFDIMSFITENDIIDASVRMQFYMAYFGHEPSESMLNRLFHFEVVHHVLWCEWAMMMYDVHHEEVYKEIATLKYKRLNECINMKKGL